MSEKQISSQAPGRDQGEGCLSLFPQGGIDLFVTLRGTAKNLLGQNRVV